LPMRLLSRRAGAGIACSEMVSATGLHYDSKCTATLMTTCPAEHPVALQIFGSDPQFMAEAAQKAVAQGADVVDLNMGCTAPKVVKTGAGAALLAAPKLATEIVQAVVAAVAQPVTVKLRAGLKAGDTSYLTLAGSLVEAGAAALTLHGRTVEQRFMGKCRLQSIAALVQAVPVPVIGNGDLDGPEAARRMFEETGCAAVMIGRAAIGNPWIFAQVAARLRGEDPLVAPPPRQRAAVALCHAQMLVSLRGERTGVLKMRPVLARYMAGLPGARQFRARIMRTTTLAEIKALLLAFVSGLEQPSQLKEPKNRAPYSEHKPGLIQPR